MIPSRTPLSPTCGARGAAVVVATAFYKRASETSTVARVGFQSPKGTSAWTRKPCGMPRRRVGGLTGARGTVGVNGGLRRAARGTWTLVRVQEARHDGGGETASCGRSRRSRASTKSKSRSPAEDRRGRTTRPVNAAINDDSKARRPTVRQSSGLLKLRVAAGTHDARPT